MSAVDIVQDARRRMSVIDLSGIPREWRYQENDRVFEVTNDRQDLYFVVWLGVSPSPSGKQVIAPSPTCWSGIFSMAKVTPG